MSRISRVKKATSIASTFAIALGIGFAMQYGDANAARYSLEEVAVVRKPVLIIDYSPLREMEEFELKPEPLSNLQNTANIAIDPDSVKLVALVEEIAKEEQNSLFAPAPTAGGRATDCEIVAVTAPDDRGSVFLSITSECRANATFLVNHNGMTFSAQTDDLGKAVLTIPAMSIDATFFVTFEDGKSLATSTYVPTADQYNRVVFQWEGHMGAYLEETDTISAMASVDRLGKDIGEIPRFVEVYSFPARLDLPDGLDGIDVVASVTDHNCNQDLIAESFTIFPGVVDLKFKDIRVTLPSCDHIGETIGLKKILGEQTLAAR